MKNKHLSFEERIYIEECLDKGISIHQISLKLNRPDSSIVREIKRNRTIKAVPERKMCQGQHLHDKDQCTKRFKSNECVYMLETGKRCYRTYCMDCNEMCNEEHCEDFTPYVCRRLEKSPFVCNGCPKRGQNGKCMELGSYKYVYRAKLAQAFYEENLRDSRVGISLSEDEMLQLDKLVSPLLTNGQSIRAIYMTHKDEIPCSESTLYNYVDRCYLTARNIDMPRKVRYKARYNHGPRKIHQESVVGRTYMDFTKYIDENPDVTIWEMDTVIGTQNDQKSLLTLLCRKTTFMIAILLERHTQEAVIEALNWLSHELGIEQFQRIFQVILTDRGPEFGNPYALECDENGEIKTKIFYCDPYCSWQKGMIERNHEFIRMVLPKGKSFESLSQKDVHLMMNHINNYPRASLNGISPYEISQLLLGKRFLSALHYHKIRPDDVILKEKLLRKPQY